MILLLSDLGHLRSPRSATKAPVSRTISAVARSDQHCHVWTAGLACDVAISGPRVRRTIWPLLGRGSGIRCGHFWTAGPAYNVATHGPRARHALGPQKWPDHTPHYMGPRSFQIVCRRRGPKVAIRRVRGSRSGQIVCRIRDPSGQIVRPEAAKSYAATGFQKWSNRTPQ